MCVFLLIPECFFYYLFRDISVSPLRLQHFQIRLYTNVIVLSRDKSQKCQVYELDAHNMTLIASLKSAGSQGGGFSGRKWTRFHCQPIKLRQCLGTNHMTRLAGWGYSAAVHGANLVKYSSVSISARRCRSSNDRWTQGYRHSPSLVLRLSTELGKTPHHYIYYV